MDVLVSGVRKRDGAAVQVRFAQPQPRPPLPLALRPWSLRPVRHRKKIVVTPKLWLLSYYFKGGAQYEVVHALTASEARKANQTLPSVHSVKRVSEEEATAAVARSVRPKGAASSSLTETGMGSGPAPAPDGEAAA